MSLIDQAHELARLGQVGEAVLSLEQGGRAGDANCWVELGAWYLQGRPVARDLAKSREAFRLAGEAGHARAREIHMAFVANGTGGPADWQAALALLSGAVGSDPLAERELALIDRMGLGDNGDVRGAFARERVSTAPEAFVFPALFSPEECDFLMLVARPALEPSLVVDPGTGRQIPNPVRTSDAAHFPLVSERPAIHALNRRLAAASGTSVAQGEPLQVLRYRPGQQYRAHFDALPPGGNQRVLTFLVYLNDDFEGGETHFLHPDLKVRGRKGDGLLFRNAGADGRPDPHSRHAGLPVTSGEKYLASRWIREKPLEY